MDQLKVALAIVKKHYFWFLCGLASLVGLWAWNSATAKVSGEFDQYKSDISRRVDEQRQIVQQNPNHPNQLVIEGYEQLNDQLRRNVLEVWQKLYDKQREEVLSWPRELRTDFLEFINTKKFGEPIPIEYRERYQNYVRERFGELSKIVKAREVELTAVGGEGAGYTEGPRRPMLTPDGTPPVTDEAYLVEWARENQEQLQSKLVWDEPPSSVKMWISQEDLWVYETLLGIIDGTNDGSTGPHNAKVTMIHALETGKDASPGSITRGRVMLLKALEAAEEGEEVAPVGRAEEMPLMGGEGRAAGTEVDQEALDRLMLAGRYLDTAGKPIILEEGSTQTPSSDEFKRVPVRMVLQMDPREIPRLLVECANAPLPVEVQQVRLNVDSAGQTGGGGEMGMGAPVRRGRTQTETSPTDPRDLRQVAQVKVVVQGIIYIFNPPNLEKLGIEPTEPADAADEAAVETSEAAEPAADEPTTEDVDPEDVDPAAEATEPAPAATEPAADPAGAAPAATPPAAEPVEDAPAAAATDAADAAGN